MSLRAGLIGAGYLGRFHAQKYMAIEGVEFCVVYDRDGQRAAALASELGPRVKVAHTLEEFIKQVDLVSVVASTRAHAEIGHLLLEQGIHCLMEKPMTHDFESAKVLVQAVQANPQVTFQVGHIERFNPAFQWLKSNVNFKDASVIQLTRLTPFNSRGADVDVVMDLMIHDIDLVCQAWGVPQLNSIAAAGVQGFATDKLDDFDFLAATLHFENGQIAQLTAGRGTTSPVRQMRVMTRENFFEVDLAKLQILKCFPDRSGAMTVVTSESIEVPKIDALDAEIRSFVESIRKKKTPIVTAHESAMNIEIAEAICRAARPR